MRIEYIKKYRNRNVGSEEIVGNPIGKKMVEGGFARLIDGEILQPAKPPESAKLAMPAIVEAVKGMTYKATAAFTNGDNRAGVKKLVEEKRTKLAAKEAEADALAEKQAVKEAAEKLEKAKIERLAKKKADQKAKIEAAEKKKADAAKKDKNK